MVSDSLEARQIVEVRWSDRWQAYRRLQELEIPCSCSSGQPLKVLIRNTSDAIQVWSVIRQFNESRYQLASWLNGCLQKSCHN